MKYTGKNKVSHPEFIEAEAGNIYEKLSKTGLSSSGEIGALLEDLKVAPEDESSFEVTMRVSWSVVQWVRSGRPLLKITPELRDMLLQTEPPEEALDVLPEIPFEGFYLLVEGFTLWDTSSGRHQVEGIHVCKDKMRLKSTDVDGREGLMIIAVGEDKGGGKKGLLRNDTLQFFGIVPDKKLDFWKDNLEGMKETLQVVLNLLFLWNAEDSPITSKTVTPQAPKSPGKRKKLERRGYSLVKYVSLGLKKGYLDHGVSKDEVANWTGETHIAVVRGFFRRYSVSEPGEAQVLKKTETSSGKTLYQIRRFIKPHKALRRGAAPQPNTYEIKHVTGP